MRISPTSPMHDPGADTVAALPALDPSQAAFVSCALDVARGPGVRGDPGPRARGARVTLSTCTAPARRAVATGEPQFTAAC